ncbi:MAG TPA: serine hydrolase domain-containing protein [Anaerolineaceae bacterium]|nr:serine hydrolase domain-containing protein [Anaerolineaceae bacterium]
MVTKINETFLNQVVQNMLKNKSVFGAVLCVEKGDGSISWVGGAGNIKAEDRYFIASVTKLYVTAVMLMLRAEKKLAFTDKISQYFPDELIDGIHVLDGVDYSKEITIAHLLSNTSGIPDYFFYEKPQGEAANDLILGDDQAWPLEKAMQRVKTLKPKFKPGQKGKVNYSDTNYQLLGGIIEKVTGKWIGHVFKEFIFQPLNLKDTYAYQDINDTTPVPMYHKSHKIHAPNYMASVTAEGGIVSTAKECMIFLKAFFNGAFFPVETLDELKQNWNMILFPGQFYFGLGLEKLWTPWFLSPFKPIKEILGFWGQTGAFAFYNPETDLYFTGTINQASGFGHSAAFNGILKIIKSVK